MIMHVFRAVAITAGGVWIGAMVTMGAIAAPTTFRVMRETGVAQPNSIAGQVMAENFRRLDWLQIACCGVLVLWQVIHMAAGGKSRRDWFRLVMIVAAAGLLAYSVAVITPQITDLQPILKTADAEAAVQAKFDAFHDSAVRVSQAIMFLALVIVMEMALPGRQAPPAAGPPPAGRK